MTVDKILTAILEKRGWSKAQLGRAIGVVTPQEAEEKPSKATDVINKRMKQKNISVKILAEMLKPLGYTIVIVPDGQVRRDGEYEVSIDE